MSDAQSTTTPRRPRQLPPLMTLSEAAADRLRALYGRGQAGMLLRIGVSTKGCSGMSYTMDWVAEPGPGDEKVIDKDISILVDRRASLFLIGTEMDYASGALSSGFHFHNPNEKGRCGCGESFHI